MNVDTLVTTLDSPTGFAAVMKGMFRNGKGKKSHAIWVSARRKGVHETVELRFATHDSYGYVVMAFSEHGPMDLRTAEILAAQAERVPLGTIRRESTMYSSLQPLADTTGHIVSAIGDPYPGVHVFSALTSPKGANRPLVAHCVVDGVDYVYPIPADRLS